MLLSNFFAQEWQVKLIENLVPFGHGAFWENTSSISGGDRFAMQTYELLRIQVEFTKGISRVRTISAHNEIRRISGATAALVTEVRKPTWKHAWLFALFIKPERQFLRVPA